MSSISYQDLPTVKSRNKNQLDKLFQFIFKEDDDDKEAIKQHFQGVLARKKPENVKDALKQCSSIARKYLRNLLTSWLKI